MAVVDLDAIAASDMAQLVELQKKASVAGQGHLVNSEVDSEVLLAVEAYWKEADRHRKIQAVRDRQDMSEVVDSYQAETIVDYIAVQVGTGEDTVLLEHREMMVD